MIDLASMVPNQTLKAELHELCRFCNANVVDTECVCTRLCARLNCRHRYTTWDGSWCPVAYISTPDGFSKPPVPTILRGNE